MRRYESAGVAVPEILLPADSVSKEKWAIVACDQYTSQPEYWQKADELVGDSPSTLRMIYPEAFLNEPNPKDRIVSIRKHMQEYLDQGKFKSIDGMVYVQRTASGKVRHGLVMCIDLERYDYHKGSKSLVRASEGTILERIPPRIEIRQGAPLELPHIMILIDDPSNTVIGPVQKAKDSLEKVYDFELMMNSGHLTGYVVPSGKLEQEVMQNLEKLGDPDTFSAKYDLPKETPVLVYAMGDGNHSLATAKAIWEKTKSDAKNVDDVMNSPTRYALVEIVNLHDESLVFEPIHRVVFGIGKGKDLLKHLEQQLGAKVETVSTVQEMTDKVRESTSEHQRFGVIQQSGFSVVHVGKALSNLPVGSVQAVLDEYLKEGGAREVDYVHGTDPVVDLGQKPDNMGIFLPGTDKADLFKSMIVDGALPRKTFSMGEAEDKRFYMECRKLT